MEDSFDYEKFICLVEEKSGLYQLKSSLYKDRDYVANAWKEIGHAR
jgi:hypothetical protein